jgi:hypothetical protein
VEEEEEEEVEVAEVVDEETALEIEECDGTLSAMELNIQLLRATIATRCNQRAEHAAGGVAAAEPLDEAALTASLPPSRYDTIVDDSDHGMGSSAHAGNTADDGVEEEVEEETMERTGDEAEAEEETDGAASEETMEVVEESPPPELDGRVGALRRAAVEELGAPTFDAVYRYLREQQLSADADGDGEHDEAMRGDLMRIMGESKLRFWPLVDQLVFLEEMSARDSWGGCSGAGSAGWPMID